MEYLIVAFRSRSSTVKFNQFLSRNKIPSEIVSTPRELEIGCGLSVKSSLHYVNVIKKAVRMTALASFVGVFQVKTVGGSTFVKSI